LVARFPPGTQVTGWLTPAWPPFAFTPSLGAVTDGFELESAPTFKA
jgi:hypothetical protein